MVIVCSTDNNYVMPLCVMLCSLFENNKEEEIQLHVLCGNVTEDNKGKITRLVLKYNKDIMFHDMDDRDFSDFPIKEKYQAQNISLATYYRLFLPKILPETIKKVIYIDCDMIVRKSLKPLWDMDIDNYAVAGVLDPENNLPFAYNRLKYPQKAGYFNAGLLVINLHYWRVVGAIVKFYSIAANKQIELKYHDQDIINLCFYKEKRRISFQYNLQNDFLYKTEYLRLSWEFWDELNECLVDPTIIHYIYAEKPWFIECNHPYKDEFVKYYKMTEWKNEPFRKLYNKRVCDVFISFLKNTYHYFFPKKKEQVFRNDLFLK